MTDYTETKAQRAAVTEEAAATLRAAEMREKILATKPAAPTEVVIPEWGTDPVHMKVLSAKDISEWGDRKQDSMGRLLVLCVVDAEGTRMFTDADVKAVMELPAPGVMRAFNEAARINGLDTAAMDEAMATFDGTPGEDSDTD